MMNELFENGNKKVYNLANIFPMEKNCSPSLAAPIGEAVAAVGGGVVEVALL